MNPAYTPEIIDQVSVEVGGFACSVTGIELREGGFEIVTVEHEPRRDSFFGVGFDDDEQFPLQCLGLLAVSFTPGRDIEEGVLRELR